MTYAQYTKVSVEKTQMDIINFLKKRGAKGFMIKFEEKMIGFQMEDRNVVIRIKPPNRNDFI